MINRPLIAILICLLLASCGGQDPQEEESLPPLQCGSGTILQDGQCVLDEFQCPPDQVPTPTGTCQHPDVFCEQTSSHFDSQRGECVSSADIRCGPGTIEEEGRCVVEDAATCAPGTLLYGGFCILAEEVCGAGTELTDLQCELIADVCEDHSEFDFATLECVDRTIIECGDNTVQIADQCVSSSSAGDVDELAAHADIDFSESSTIELGSEPGDRFIATGTLTRESNFFHAYKVQANEGQWVELTLYSRGLPSPGFRLRQIFGPWQRNALPGYSSAPSRTVLFPASEEYDFIVETSETSTDVGPLPGDSWQYVAVATLVEPPEPQLRDLYNGPLDGDLQQARDNFLEVDLSDEIHTLFLPQLLGVDAANTFLEIWSSPTDFAERFPLVEDTLININAANYDSPIYLHIDSRGFAGPRTSYALQALETSILQPGQKVTEEVEAHAGQVIFISHRSTETSTVRARVLFDDEELYRSEQSHANNQEDYLAIESRYAFFYVPEDGIYTLEYENISGAELTGFFPDSWAEDLPLFTIDPEHPSQFNQTLPADELKRGNWRFILFQSTGPARVTGTAEVDSGLPDISIFDLQSEEVDDFTGTGTLQEMEFNIWTPRTYLLAVRPFRTLFGDIELDLHARPLDALSSNETLTETFEAQTFDILTGTAQFLDGASPELTLLSPNASPVFQDIEMPREREILELLPGTGTYSFEFINHSDDPTLDLQLDYEVTTPFAVLDHGASFTEVFERPTPLAAGEKEMVVVRTTGEFIFQVIAELGADEEASIRVRDLTTAETIISGEAFESIELNSGATTNAIFVLEIEALTDLENGYDLELAGAKIELITLSYATDEPIFIENTGESTGGYLSPTLSASGCDQIIEASLVLNFDSLEAIFIHVLLHTPALAQPIHLHEPFWNSSNTQLRFPQDLNTGESLETLVGLSGNGGWSVEITATNSSSIFDSYFVGWSLELICTI